MASDIDAIGALYEAPLMAVREGRVKHFSDREAVRTHLAKLMAAYQDAGATRAGIADIHVTTLGKSSSMVTVHWHVRDATGAMVRDFRTTYHILRVDGTWRILSYTNHDD